MVANWRKQGKRIHRSFLLDLRQRLAETDKRLQANSGTAAVQARSLGLGIV